MLLILFYFFVIFVLFITEWSVQGKKQELRLESLAALEKVIRDVLTILGLMPASYSEVCKFIMTKPVSFLRNSIS